MLHFLKLKLSVTKPFSGSFVWFSELHRLGTPWLFDVPAKKLVLSKPGLRYLVILSLVDCSLFSPLKAQILSGYMSYAKQCLVSHSAIKVCTGEEVCLKGCPPVWEFLKNGKEEKRKHAQVTWSWGIVKTHTSH